MPSNKTETRMIQEAMVVPVLDKTAENLVEYLGLENPSKEATQLIIEQLTIRHNILESMTEEPDDENYFQGVTA